MRNRTFKVAALAAAISAFVLMFGLTAADATRTVRIGSKITINGKGLTFSGRVKSNNSACKSNRTVTLYAAPSMKLGSVTTGSSGRWKITPSGFAGISLHHFYATVKRRSEGTAGTIYVCKGAKSRTIPFTQQQPSSVPATLLRVRSS